MTDSGGEGFPATDPARPRDGTVNFASYSLQQLRDLEQVIDPLSQPLNHANLLAEIARRAAPSEDAGPGSPGRFSARDGWLGWLEAKRRRSPVFGAGRLEVGDAQVTLHGWRRTWLGAREPGISHLSTSYIRNTVCDGEWLQFESKRKLLPARRIRFRASNPQDAQILAGKLPQRQTEGFASRWHEIRQFQANIDALGGIPWSVYALVLVNVAIFIWMAIAQRGLSAFDISLLTSHGASFGPAVMEGQWWRLFTAQFLHANIYHLLSNLWVLFNAGLLARQLFGNATLLFLYLACGICGFVASIAWNPGIVAVGASGAIFGVFGALIAFMTFQRAQLPRGLLRAHWLSTLVFAAFNLVSGFVEPNIDNAAHVGGLCAGFLLGYILARPLRRDARRQGLALRYSAATAIVLCIAAAGYFQVRGLAQQADVFQKFTRDNAWYAQGESANLQKWQQMATMAGMGAISDAELSRQFRTAILPFWKEAAERFDKDASFTTAKTGSLQAVMLQFARVRRDWAEAIADATGSRDQARFADSARLMTEATHLQSRIERLRYRAQMEYRPRALAHSRWINHLRGLFTHWECLESPSYTGRKRSPDDSPEDAPAMAYVTGCRAQELFHERDYLSLETLMRDSAAHLNDLPNGGSSLDAVFRGLSDLITEGQYDVEGLLGRTADWRRAVQDPLMAELVEAMIFQSWAWSARGHSTADEISAQSWALFEHRSQMAAAALESLQATAQDNPAWYDLSIDVALDISDDKKHIREIFDAGVQRFPTYLPLYGSMLRVLMPRWTGSHEEVDELIKTVTTHGADQDLELYAQLYWTYFLLEQDQLDIFVDGRAGWNNLDIGFASLLKRYPRSDYWLNAYLVMACVVLDRERYAELRPQLGTRKSALAWSDKYSMAECDRRSRPRPTKPGFSISRSTFR